MSITQAGVTAYFAVMFKGGVVNHSFCKGFQPMTSALFWNRIWKTLPYHYI